MKMITKKIAILLVMALLMTSISTISATPTTVLAKTKKVKLSKTKATVYVGKTVTLKLKNNKKKVKWSTSNKKVATVTKKGKVKGKKAGKATITATVGKKKYKCKVIVKTNKKSKNIQETLPTYAVEISNNLDATSAYDKISITIKNTGIETIFLGNYTDLQEKYMKVYNVLAGSILYQSNETGYCLIPATTIYSGESKTLEFTRLYTFKSDFQWYKTFHLCNASYFEIPIYSNNYLLHTEKCYVN